MKKNILVTGGAGFIGSNLVEKLLLDARVDKVRVLDNLSNGFKKNIDRFLSNDRFEFIEGDIRNFELCLSATQGIDLISHQAALGSVPRSIKDPITSNDVNIGGTLNIFKAAVDNRIERVVFAASSSTYGDSEGLPKVENKIGKPLSPYAVTKFVNELYADVFQKTYDFNYVGLRYFNVFGPYQDPDGAYAAVIPLFFKAAIQNVAPIINGDGSNSRDFTFVTNAVNANLLALFTQDSQSLNQVYNVACGEHTTLIQLWNLIKAACDSWIEPSYGPSRLGDIPHSLASIDKIQNLLKYNDITSIKDGIILTKDYYLNMFNK